MAECARKYTLHAASNEEASSKDKKCLKKICDGAIISSFLPIYFIFVPWHESSRNSEAYDGRTCSLRFSGRCRKIGDDKAFHALRADNRSILILATY